MSKDILKQSPVPSCCLAHAPSSWCTLPPRDSQTRRNPLEKEISSQISTSFSSYTLDREVIEADPVVEVVHQDLVNKVLLVL